MNDPNQNELRQLAEKLGTLRSEMLALESSLLDGENTLHEAHRASARNLAHYLALRRHDIRQMQEQLAGLGLSSLGRSEGHVMNTLESVLKVLGTLAEIDVDSHAIVVPYEIGTGTQLLEKNTDVLLGPCPQDRRVRIMVTMPSEAATDYTLVRDLLAKGMDCMRINCAHDDESAWAGMIRNLQKAREEMGRNCRILMDLAGPKLRTGPIEPGPAVIKCRPKRNEFGHVVSPARIWLTPSTGIQPPPSAADVCLPVSAALISRLHRGDIIAFRDARSAHRSLKVVSVAGAGCWCALSRTAYFVPGIEFRVKIKSGEAKASVARASVVRCRLDDLPKTEQKLLLKQRDTLLLTRSMQPGKPAKYDKQNRLVSPAQIGVTMPEFFDHVKPGEPVWLDDGKIGGIIKSVDSDAITVEITQARASGEKLGADKGINLPESELRLPSLTDADQKALKFIVEHADLVGYSFVRTEGDVRKLLVQLSELGGELLGVILKIETRKAFDNLPRLILATMRIRAVGVMIARGDLAVECGYQRLAEIQEEILWVCEAAHVPVIWATQVLENLAKTGMPSRSEITDAAMGERAECVMLNKGPYVVNAVAILDDILKRMQAHQEKKRSMLRKLHLASSFAGAS